MSWNYRVVHRRYPLRDRRGDTEEQWGIYEVYYDDATGSDGDDAIDGVSATEAPCYGESLDEAWRTFNMMAAAFGKPVLEWDDISKEDEP